VFLQIFTSILLPLVLIVSLAFLLGRSGRQDYGPLARVSFYLFNPSLAFVAMASTTITPDLFGQLVLFKVSVFILVVLLARFVASRLGLTGPAVSAFLLASAFANSGNFGLFVVESAFGKAGLALAMICYVTDNITINSVGVYIAARGRTSPVQAFAQVFRNPAVYAVPLGLLVNRLGVALPAPLMTSLEMMSRAAVPTMMVVLGMQLAAMPGDQGNRLAIGFASLIRLVAAPLLGIVLVTLMGMTGLARQVAILEVAVPTAVLASIVAARYNTEPGLVAGAVLVTSLASLVSITLLLSWML
jgi:predicted permease